MYTVYNVYNACAVTSAYNVYIMDCAQCAMLHTLAADHHSHAGLLATGLQTLPKNTMVTQDCLQRGCKPCRGTPWSRAIARNWVANLVAEHLVLARSRATGLQTLMRNTLLSRDRAQLGCKPRRGTPCCRAIARNWVTNLDAEHLVVARSRATGLQTGVAEHHGSFKKDWPRWKQIKTECDQLKNIKLTEAMIIMGIVAV